MPLYEYKCDTCGARFTKLQPMSAPREGYECPSCGQTTTRRVMSSFATSGTENTGASACGSVGGRFR
jgi:putative FmdB family regulatory protein